MTRLVLVNISEMILEEDLAGTILLNSFPLLTRGKEMIEMSLAGNLSVRTVEFIFG